MTEKKKKSKIKKILKRGILFLFVAYVIYYLRLFNPHDFWEIDESVFERPEKVVVEKEHNLYWTIRSYIEKLNKEAEKIHKETEKQERISVNSWGNRSHYIFEEICERDERWEEIKDSCEWVVSKKQKILFASWTIKKRKEIMEETIAPELYNFLQNNPDYVKNLSQTLENDIFYLDPQWDVSEISSESWAMHILWSRDFANQLLSAWIYACVLWNYEDCNNYVYLVYQFWTKSQEDSVFVWYLIGEVIEEQYLVFLDTILNYYVFEKKTKNIRIKRLQQKLDKQKLVIKDMLLNEYRWWINFIKNQKNASKKTSEEYWLWKVSFYPFFDKKDTQYLLWRFFEILIKSLDNSQVINNEDKNFLFYISPDFLSLSDIKEYQYTQSAFLRKNYIWLYLLREISPNLFGNIDRIFINSEKIKELLTKLSD